ncbi:MAG: glycosyltransferase, partial [Candidatus Binatia bacterium]|nr:glycosyltransferase [Candidatus Binatia bacterium]
MRIAFLVDIFPKLSESFILDQITGLLDRGHEVDIFAVTRGRETTVHPDVEKYRLLERTYYVDMPHRKWQRLRTGLSIVLAQFPRHPAVVLRTLNVFRFGRHAVSLWLLHLAAPFLDKGPYDVLHCQFGPNGNRGLLLKKLGVVDGKLVTTFHGNDLPPPHRLQYGSRVYDQLFAGADLICCVSAHIKEQLVALGCETHKIVVHRAGVDTQKFPLRPPTPARDGTVRVLTIARLVEKKGVEYGIRAVATLIARYPQLEYRIVGDGPLREELTHLIASLGAEHHITLLGWKQREEIVELLQRSDILLAPSVTAAKGDPQEGIP